VVHIYVAYIRIMCYQLGGEEADEGVLCHIAGAPAQMARAEAFAHVCSRLVDELCPAPLVAHGKERSERCGAFLVAKSYSAGVMALNIRRTCVTSPAHCMF
jgi:hypothetical protein